MKSRSLFILLVLLLGLIPLWYIQQYLKRVIQPRHSPPRFFLFLFANFLLIILYTLLLVGLVTRIFPAPMHLQ